MLLPPYSEYPTLHAGALVLRQILPADIDDVVEISFYDGQPAAGTAEALDMLERIHRDYEAGNSIHWGIADQGSNTILGTCGYYRGFANASGELGCVLRPAFRRRGTMTQALQAAMDFGFGVMGLERITAVTTHQNVGAIRLLERLHFVQLTGQPDGAVDFIILKGK